LTARRTLTPALDRYGIRHKELFEGLEQGQDACTEVSTSVFALSTSDVQLQLTAPSTHDQQWQSKFRVQDLLEFLRQRPGQCGLIYARQRETCDSLARSLRCSHQRRVLDTAARVTLLLGVCSSLSRICRQCDPELDGHMRSCADIDVEAYHAGKDAASRSRIQADWTQGHTAVLVSTVAFGMCAPLVPQPWYTQLCLPFLSSSCRHQHFALLLLPGPFTAPDPFCSLRLQLMMTFRRGIDKADVRWVVHWDPPSSLDGFYQESGRCQVLCQSL
jgi:superfamily II DNA/RNA helicase